MLDRHAAGKELSPRSKRWWTDEAKQQRKLFAKARRAHSDDRICFDEYRRARNDYHTLVQRVKRLAWESFLEDFLPSDGKGWEAKADPGRCWQALRYTKPQVLSYTPAIKVAGVDG